MDYKNQRRLRKQKKQEQFDKSRSVCFHTPVGLVSILNLREHWAKRAKRAKGHREAGFFNTYTALHKANWRPEKEALIIIITKLGKRRWDDDNLSAGCKNLRDGIAQALRRDDGDTSLAWIYRQKDKYDGKRSGAVVEIREYVQIQPMNLSGLVLTKQPTTES